MQLVAEQPLLARFAAVHGQLAEALQRKEWARFTALDLEVRACLLALASVAAPSDELLQVKLRLKQLHGQAIKACAEACEALRRSLLTHLEYAEGRSAYLRVDLFQGGS